MITQLDFYGAVLPRRRPHHVSILSVRLSVRLSCAYFFLHIVLGMWAIRPIAGGPQRRTLLFVLQL